MLSYILNLVFTPPPLHFSVLVYPHTSPLFWFQTLDLFSVYFFINIFTLKNRCRFSITFFDPHLPTFLRQRVKKNVEENKTIEIKTLMSLNGHLNNTLAVVNNYLLRWQPTEGALTFSGVHHTLLNKPQIATNAKCQIFLKNTQQICKSLSVS